jgi:DNA-directed RNA polymerase specialized sigma24 family protein
MEVDPDRPVYVVGKDAGVETTVPCPDDVETVEIKLPLDVLEELVSRLLTLPQELRDVVCWRFMGLEYKEIARKQKLTTAGAEARHDRAMQLFPELRQLFIVKTARKTMRRAALMKGICGV